MWEVSIINKQKFLAELAKLLTFMYEEDRQRALAAYSEMFDEAEDEQQLLQALNSPLRQAVEVARAYNSARAGLSPTAPSKEDDDTASDAFMETIYRIRAEALSTQEEPEVISEDQISLFDTEDVPEEEAASEEESAEEEAPAEEDPEAGPAEEEPAEEEAAEDETEEAEAAAEEAEEEDEEEDEDEEGDELAALAMKTDKDFRYREYQPTTQVPVQKTVRKPRILLLILYILIAIPIGAVGIVLLLVPALASLGVALACIVVAVLGISVALTSFPKIANLLVAFGAALILLAVGLVFLMLFVWFLGGAIGGLINGLITLGGNWCYKEVPVE